VRRSGMSCGGGGKGDGYRQGRGRAVMVQSGGGICSVVVLLPDLAVCCLVRVTATAAI
jgi:hypothetical protein